MKKQHLINRPTKISEISFDEFYEGISQDWQLRAERLQARRWRSLMHAIKDKRHLKLT